MEPASKLVSRRLPELYHSQGTINPSIPSESLSARYMHEWSHFKQEVLDACHSLDLGAEVSLTDEDERFIVGSELGLASRFNRNVCDAVAKALSTTRLSHLKFGDVQAIRPQYTSRKVPDVAMLAMLADASLKPILVGELETFWTFPLEDVPVDAGVPFLDLLEPYMGQLVSYMRTFGLKYGFLTTYRSTVFCRRVADFRFELSLPIDQAATTPSVRQCFAALCSMAVAESAYTESSRFDSLQLDCPGLQATRPYSPRTRRPSSVGPLSDTGLGSRSIIFGDRAGVAVDFVNCVDSESHYSPGNGKAIFEVMAHGKPAIAKCWPDELEESFIHEASTYERIDGMYPTGTGAFPSVMAYGKIVCSSIFPSGWILVISKAEGVALSTLWNDLTLSERIHVRSQCRKALSILREAHAICVDAGKHNILYDRDTGTTTMIDFERMKECDQERLHRLDVPEMYATFGPEFSRDPASGG